MPQVAGGQKLLRGGQTIAAATSTYIASAPELGLRYSTRLA